MRTILRTLFLAALFSFIPFFAHAGSEHNLVGWAWSDNIGWISFNSTNVPDSNDYGVYLASNGDLCGNESCSVPGYAWSDNVGWIQFGGLSAFPSGTSTVSSNAKLNGSTLQGWARAIAADGNGWDGWISLSNSNYGVTKAGSHFTGYAWGSDVVGWIDFDPSTVGVRLSSDVTFDIKSGGAGGASIVGETVPYNTVPTFVWTMVNSPSATCSITKTSSGGSTLNPPAGSLTGLTSSGSHTPLSGLTHSPSTSQWPYTYRMQCTNPTIDTSLSFVVDRETAAFTLGAADTARIQFLVSGEANSEIKTVTVNSFGGYSNPVTISISGYPTPPAGTTFQYSLGGGSFSATPSSVVVSPGNSTTFQVKVSKAINSQYTVTLHGVGAGAPDQYKNIIINPTTYDPNIKEF